MKSRAKRLGLNSLTFPRRMYLFAAPALALFLVFWVFPLIQMFFYSFTNFNGINFNYDFVGLKNFVNIFKDGTLGNSIRNTLVYTIVMVGASNLLGLAIALALNSNIRLKTLFRTCCYIPALFSAIVVGFIWSYVYMPRSGLLVSLITLVGGDASKLNILGNHKVALYGIALVEVWKGFGSTMIIYLAGLQTLDENLLEAARIDGCNEWQLMRLVKLPLISATITINVILSAIGGLKAFDYAFIMTSGGPGKATNTLMFNVYRIAFNEQLMGKASALSVISFFCIIIVTVLMLYVMNKREVEL
ncbi:MAG: sugar ABC transporter permease [Clostridiales bacterium]|nr:sugar ABC transporter permease [Clostridiales bacterium]